MAAPAAPPEQSAILALAHALKTALERELTGAHVDLEDAGNAAALTFEHPAHRALCLALLEPDAAAGVALVAAVIVADLAEFASPQALVGLMTLNARLMTCAIGALPINQDEMAIVLCRRMPAEAIEPAELPGLYNDMIWEWAQVSKQTAEMLEAAPQPPAQTIVAPPRPRLIGSLDEL